MPPSLSYAQLFVKFFGVFFFYLRFTCSEMDFTPEKSFSFNYKNSQLFLTAAAALSQMVREWYSRGIKGIKNAFLRPITMR